MNSLLRLAYEGAAVLAQTAVALVPESESKVIRSLRGRRGVLTRFAHWGSSGRDRARPLLWMHAPSVGEGLQARPVLERLRASHPRLQLAYTFFSPSAHRFAAGLDVDFRDYLPIDSTAHARAALDSLGPSALVFCKLDLWPMLVREASNRGIPLGLISATLSESSSRRGAFARALLRDAYGRLDAVGAVDAADAERLAAIGVRREVLSVTGDTRYDQVWARARAADPASSLLAPLRSSRPTLVAGSTWAADEAVLLPAWERLHGAVATARLVIAPHEPVAIHIASLRRWATRAGFSHALLDEVAAASADIVIVDRVGVLGELYALADVAFVGGAFHAAGLHSVLEPAAFGAPVLFGPRHQGSRDAAQLLAVGAAIVLADAASGALALEHWLRHPESRREAGTLARGVVQAGLGAADRSAALIASLL